MTGLPDADPVPPACRATVERIQRALDGGPAALGADPHAAVCTVCRERVRAAGVLLSVLAAPPTAVAVPFGFADRVLAAVAADRRVERPLDRRGRVARVARVGAWAALAAAVVVGTFYLAARQRPTAGPVETANPAEVAPAPRERPARPDPPPQPVRLGDEFAKAGQALLGAPQPLTESVAAAPRLIEAFTGPFKPSGPPPEPVSAAIEPARRSLAELPVAARTGLEPVTATAEKAFNRFLSDMGAVKPKS